MTSWNVSEANCDEVIEGDALEEDEMILVYLSDFRRHSVVEGLQSESVSNRRIELPRRRVDMASPGLVYNLVTQDIQVVLEGIGHIHPEVIKSISNAFVVLIQRFVSNAFRK